tara:strand:- start:96 stop:476 length:381 start_codon:yes stop_codon:yes gene_type:complete
MDYYEALKKLYIPQFGSIWKAPNRIWTSGFARFSDGNKVHPSVVDKVFSDKITVSLVPGTSKEKHGSCVFKSDLTNDGIKTYFLINLAMPYHVDDLKNLEYGFRNVYELKEEQKEDFKRQIKFCRG